MSLCPGGCAADLGGRRRIDAKAEDQQPQCPHIGCNVLPGAQETQESLSSVRAHPPRNDASMGRLATVRSTESTPLKSLASLRWAHRTGGARSRARYPGGPDLGGHPKPAIDGRLKPANGDGARDVDRRRERRVSRWHGTRLGTERNANRYWHLDVWGGRCGESRRRQAFTGRRRAHT